MKWAWTLSGVYTCVILTLTSLPSDRLLFISKLDLSDVVNHAALYLPLGILVFRALSITYSRLSLTYCWLYTFLICAGFGAFDEAHQLFIPGRWCDIHDWLADLVGILAGTVAIVLYSMFKAGRQAATPTDG